MSGAAVVASCAGTGTSAGLGAGAAVTIVDLASPSTCPSTVAIETASGVAPLAPTGNLIRSSGNRCSGTAHSVGVSAKPADTTASGGNPEMRT